MIKNPVKAKNKVGNLNKSKTDISRYANPDRYHLYVSENEVLIINTQIKEQFLKINRETITAEFLPSDKLSKYKMEMPLKIFSIFGQIDINGIEFLILISKAENIAEINKVPIYVIRSVKFLTISKQKYKNFEYEKCWDYLEKMKKFLKSGFYFSYDYKIFTEYNGKLSYNREDTIKCFMQNIYTWNVKALKPLISKEENWCFFVPIIQGFVGTIIVKEFNYVIISRRSYIMGGTRYNSRGIDNNGYVGNYVETEQIVETSNSLFSFKQYRGSLPFYWEQKGLKAKVKIHQTLDINVDRFLKHLDVLNKDNNYEKIVFFNLLSNKRSEESCLTKYFCEILKEAVVKRGISNVFYDHADFHAITKETDFTNIDQFIYKLFDDKTVGYSQYDFDLLTETYVCKRKQVGIIRSNCLDCLDRTNAVQAKFAFLALYRTLKTSKIEFFDSKYNENCLALQDKSDMHFIANLRQLWADNGDAISFIYTGTGATTSSVTRRGEKASLSSFFDHGFKTISRFYLNNFDDGFKQEIIDILLNTKSTSIRSTDLITRTGDKVPVKIGIVSLVNNKSSSTIAISEKLLLEIFNKYNDCDFLMFACKLDGVKKIQIMCEDYQVYENFEYLFKTLDHLLQGFKLINTATVSSAQVLLFANPESIKNLSYFKYEKAKPSTFNKTFGVKSSFIISHYSIELFALSLEKQMFKTVQDSMQQIMDKYVDKYYDLIFVVGSIEDGLELDNINKNYTLIFEEAVKSPKETNRSNQVHLLCSKALMDKDLEPMYKAVEMDLSDLPGEVTMNCHSFIIFTDKQ